MPALKQTQNAWNGLKIAQAVTAKRFWHEEDARLVVEAWKQSGLSKRGFATHFGAKPARLEYWSRRLKRIDQEKGKPVDLYPVRVVDSHHSRNKARPKSSKSSDQLLELVFPSGICLRLSPDFDGKALRRVMEAVGC